MLSGAIISWTANTNLHWSRSGGGDDSTESTRYNNSEITNKSRRLIKAARFLGGLYFSLAHCPWTSTTEQDRLGHRVSAQSSKIETNGANTKQHQQPTPTRCAGDVGGGGKQSRSTNDNPQLDTDAQESISMDEESRWKVVNLSKYNRLCFVPVVVISMVQLIRNSWYIYVTLSVDYNEAEKNLQPIHIGFTNDSQSTTTTTTAESLFESTPDLLSVGSRRQIYQFLCLQTNCPSLSASSNGDSSFSLAESLIKLPIFTICEPHWKWFYEPEISGGASGLMITTTITFFSLIVGLGLPYLDPFKGNSMGVFEFLMFPRTVMNLSRQKTRKFWCYLKYSYRNYSASRLSLRELNFEMTRHSNGLSGKCKACSIISGKSNSRRCRGYATYSNDYKDRISQRLSFLPMSGAGASESLSSPDELLEEVYGTATETTIDESIPINVTYWWFNQFICRFTLTLSFVLIEIFCFILFFHYLIFTESISKLRKEFRGYFEHMQSNNCSIWHSPASTKLAKFEQQNGAGGGSSLQLLKYDQVVHEWTLFTFALHGLVVGPTVYISTIAIGNLNQFCNDAKVCIDELKFELLIAIEYCRSRYILGGHLVNLQLSNADIHSNEYNNHRIIMNNSTTSSTTNQKPKSVASNTEMRPLFRGKTVMALIREKFIEFEHYHSGDNLLPIRSFKGSVLKYQISGLVGREKLSRSSYQMLAIELKSLYGLGDQVFIELLENIQVHYWHLLSLFKQHNHIMFVTLTTTYLVNFSTSFASVYCYRIIKDFVTIPLVLNFASYSASVLASIWPAATNSGAKKLEPLFSTLVALNYNTNNKRIEHLRHLWMKQMDLSNLSGGFGLRLYDQCAGYVNLIELIIWTTTIMLLSYGRHGIN